MYGRGSAENGSNGFGEALRIYWEGFLILGKKQTDVQAKPDAKEVVASEINQKNETKKWLIEKGWVSSDYVFKNIEVFKGVRYSRNIEVIITFSEDSGFMKVKDTENPHTQDNMLATATPDNLEQVFKNIMLVVKVT